METKIGTTADLHYLDFSKNTKNSKNIEDKTILSTIEQTGNNVIKFIGKEVKSESKEETTTSTEENNKKALNAELVHRFSISQGGINKIVKIELSIDEVENSELLTIDAVAKDKYIKECLGGLDSSDFNISEEIEFKLLGVEGEDGFIAERGTILKEM